MLCPVLVLQAMEFGAGDAKDIANNPYRISIVNDLYDEQLQRPIETIVTSRQSRPVAPVGPAKAVTFAANAAAKTAVNAAALAAAKTGVRFGASAVTKATVTQKKVYVANVF